MFTQSMPAYVNALRQAGLPVPSLAQAIGNCGQPLTHRGPINFASPTLRQQQPGVYTQLPWQQANLPPAGNELSVDVAGMTVGWNNGNRYDSQFFFPTNQWFALNQFHGGPTVNLQGFVQIGSARVGDLSGDQVQATAVTSELLNGSPIELVPGAPGTPGRDGRPGAAGQVGLFGAFPQGQFRNLSYLFGVLPRLEGRPTQAARPERYVYSGFGVRQVVLDAPTEAVLAGVTVAATTGVTITNITVVNSASCGATLGVSTANVANPASATCAVKLGLGTENVVIPTSVSFDPDTCTVIFGSTQELTVVTGVTVESCAVTLSPDTQTVVTGVTVSSCSVTLGTESVPVVSDVGLTITVATTTAGSTSVIVGEDMTPLSLDNPLLGKAIVTSLTTKLPVSRSVLSSAKLAGFFVGNARVFQQ